MKLRYYIDEESGLPHIYGHGVTKDEVAEVLAKPITIVRGPRDSMIASGQTRAGRYLKVVFVPDRAEESAFVVTAHQLYGKPLKALRRRGRKR